MTLCRPGEANKVDPVGVLDTRWLLDLPQELQRPPRRWTARRFLDIRWWCEPGRGGHFAAFERPETFVNEVLLLLPPDPMKVPLVQRPTF
jgi:hypothetical protein